MECLDFILNYVLELLISWNEYLPAPIGVFSEGKLSYFNTSPEVWHLTGLTKEEALLALIPNF